MAVMNRDISFLWFKPTLKEAWNQNASPVLDIMERGQLHLLPFDPQPYLQITDSPISFSNVTNPDVFILDCNGQELEINDHVDIEPITDTNGIRQLFIRLKYLPVDYGMNLVCLKLVNPIEEPKYTYYSNPFLLTSLYYDRTSRVDYRVVRDYTDFPLSRNFYQGIRLSFYYNGTKSMSGSIIISIILIVSLGLGDVIKGLSLKLVSPSLGCNSNPSLG